MLRPQGRLKLTCVVWSVHWERVCKEEEGPGSQLAHGLLAWSEAGEASPEGVLCRCHTGILL